MQSTGKQSFQGHDQPENAHYEMHQLMLDLFQERDEGKSLQTKIKSHKCTVHTSYYSRRRCVSMGLVKVDNFHCPLFNGTMLKGLWCSCLLDQAGSLLLPGDFGCAASAATGANASGKELIIKSISQPSPFGSPPSLPMMICSGDLWQWSTTIVWWTAT